MKKILSLFVFISVTLLYGCATSKQYSYNYQPSQVTPSFSILDQRPEIEKKGETLSLLATSDQYGIYRFGDDQIIPDRMLYLKEQLEAKSNGKLAGKNIEIKHFLIYNNRQEMLKNMTLAGTFGMVGALIDSAVKKDADAFIDSTLELTIDSKPYSSHITTGYSENKMSGISNEALAQTIKASMDGVIDNMIKNIANVNYARGSLSTIAVRPSTRTQKASAADDDDESQTSKQVSAEDESNEGIPEGSDWSK